MSNLFVTLLFALGAIIAWDFVFQYGFRAKWNSHPYGRINIGFMGVIALVLTTIVFNSYFHHYPGRNLLRDFQYTLFVSCLIVLDIFLHRQLRKENVADRHADSGEVQPVVGNSEVSESDS